MAELRISTTWMATASGEAEVKATAGLLNISVDNISLTRNQDIWAETVRDSVFVSAYPLAMWFASSWWRLNHEPLSQQPSHDWRMAHELGAANHGFVWPRIVFTPDGEAVQVWSTASLTPEQSIQYVQSLASPKLIKLQSFQQSITTFVQSVLARLDARDLAKTALADLWSIVQDELSDPQAARRRILEAKLGFDAEECPEQALDAALQWASQVGDIALSELAPAISAYGATPDLATLGELATADGVTGSPEPVLANITLLEHGAPWQRAIHDARALRNKLGNPSGPVRNSELLELLGLQSDAITAWAATKNNSPVAVAIPMQDHRLKFVSRRRNPIGKRFELARFLGEYLRTPDHETHWLASTDTATSRQKYQRAFAAEFLCPIDALTSFLGNDFSSYAIEEAAENFEVSELTVTSLLINHGFLHVPGPESMPYQIAA